MIIFKVITFHSKFCVSSLFLFYGGIFFVVELLEMYLTNGIVNATNNKRMSTVELFGDLCDKILELHLAGDELLDLF